MKCTHAKKYIMLTFIVLISLLTGCITVTTNAGTPTLSDVVIASEVDAITYEVITAIDIFSTDSPEIHAVAQLSGGKANDTVVKSEWYYVDKEIFIDESSATAGYAEGPVWFSISRPDNGWPVGKYQVSLFVNGEQATVKFFEVQ